MSLPHEIKKHTLGGKHIQAPKSTVPDAKQTHLISCPPCSPLFFFELTGRAVFSSMGKVFIGDLESIPLYYIPPYCFSRLQPSPPSFNFENAARNNFRKRKSNY